MVRSTRQARVGRCGDRCPRRGGGIPGRAVGHGKSGIPGDDRGVAIQCSVEDGQYRLAAAPPVFRRPSSASRYGSAPGAEALAGASIEGSLAGRRPGRRSVSSQVLSFPASASTILGVPGLAHRHGEFAKEQRARKLRVAAEYVAFSRLGAAKVHVPDLGQAVSGECGVEGNSGVSDRHAVQGDLVERGSRCESRSSRFQVCLRRPADLPGNCPADAAHPGTDYDRSRRAPGDQVPASRAFRCITIASSVRPTRSRRRPSSLYARGSLGANSVARMRFDSARSSCPA